MPMRCRCPPDIRTPRSPARCPGRGRAAPPAGRAAPGSPPAGAAPRPPRRGLAERDVGAQRVVEQVDVLRHQPDAALPRHHAGVDRARRRVLPELGVWRPSTRSTSVLLPAPLMPTSATEVPAGRSRSMPRTTSSSLPWYRNVRSRTATSRVRRGARRRAPPRRSRARARTRPACRRRSAPATDADPDPVGGAEQPHGAGQHPEARATNSVSMVSASRRRCW